jgi:adenylyltransferase/sulfurtransferase
MTEKDNPRYARQRILTEIGEKGQIKLNEARALIVGCGALGSVIAEHLARAGLGGLRIVDRDTVEIENLQRQILYDERDIGNPKAISAEEKLSLINSEITIQGVVADLNPKTAPDIFADIDVVVDGTDNMQTRYLINDICVNRKIPWVYGGAVATYGMTMNIIPDETACLMCAFPQIPKAGSLPTCDTVGVLNTVPSIIASIEATEAMKIILGKKYSRDMIVYDVWNHNFQRIKLKRNLDCICCAHHEYEYLDTKTKETTTVLCGRNSVQVTPVIEGTVSLERLADRLKKIGDVKLGSVHLIFRTKDVEITVFSDGRGIVKGTDDQTLAKSIYAKYIGN